jgi:hypothetical protein
MVLAHRPKLLYPPQLFPGAGLGDAPGEEHGLKLGEG